MTHGVIILPLSYFPVFRRCRLLTRQSGRTHNRAVAPPLIRALVAVVLLPWQLAAMPAAPEHRHLALDDHDHTVVHRHFHAHHVAKHDASHAGLSTDDSNVLATANITVATPEFHLPFRSVVAATPFVSGAPSTASGIVSQASPAPIHGPPRTASHLRGPPSLLA